MIVNATERFEVDDGLRGLIPSLASQEHGVLADGQEVGT